MTVNKKLKADMLLLLAALLWGFAFVAQKKGMESTGPLIFNAIRFLLGALVILPFSGLKFKTEELIAGLQMGIILFIAASLQQFGIVYTTAGKAGFITGLYIIFVPLLGVFAGDSPSLRTWSGVVAALAGLYLLSIHGKPDIALGDSLVLLSAFFFALHVRLIAKFSQLHAPYKLAFLQFVVCGLLSTIGCCFYEETSSKGLEAALIPILYGGIISVGIAYTLQVLGQKNAPPADCAVLLSLEGAFAVIGGMIILGESISAQAAAGCLMMLAGAVLAALPEKKGKKQK